MTATEVVGGRQWGFPGSIKAGWEIKFIANPEKLWVGRGIPAERSKGGGGG
jgi:hypothetical protein